LQILFDAVFVIVLEKTNLRRIAKASSPDSDFGQTQKKQDKSRQI